MKTVVVEGGRDGDETGEEGRRWRWFVWQGRRETPQRFIRRLKNNK